jgi:hypothetical protein
MNMWMDVWMYVRMIRWIVQPPHAHTHTFTLHSPSAAVSSKDGNVFESHTCLAVWCSHWFNFLPEYMCVCDRERERERERERTCAYACVCVVVVVVLVLLVAVVVV